jgi:transposase
VKQAEIDSGTRPGTTMEDQRRIAERERELRELRRANEILKAASAYSPGNSTPGLPLLVLPADLAHASQAVKGIGLT